MEYKTNRPMSGKKRRSGKKRSKTSHLLVHMVLCIIALSALTGCIILLVQNHRLQQEAVQAMARVEQIEEETKAIKFTEEEANAIAESMAAQAAQDAAVEAEVALLDTLKDQMINGDGTVQMLRYFFPDEVVVYSDATYHFIPISENLKKHSYIYDNFIQDENQIVTYFDEDGSQASIKGIDVSKYQGSINWSKVAQDGVEYAFIRVGFRGATEGQLVEDETFETNMAGATKNGIHVGAYFFTQALTEAEAVEEAEYVLDALRPYDITYPVVIDVEDVGTKNPRTKDMTKEDWTKITIAFCERIKEAGYTPMIYGNLKTFMLMLDLEQLEDYEKWYANFAVPFYFPYDFSIWQYTSTGKVNGIKGEVDINVSMKDFGLVE